MTRVSFFAAFKIFVAQGALQLLLNAHGLALEQGCLVACAALMVAPLYSSSVREVYAQAFAA